MNLDIQLTEWSETLLDKLVEYANNPHIAANMRDSFPHPFTEERGKAFIQYARTSETSKIKAVLYKGALAGSIGLHLQNDISRKNAELGYWLAEPFWGKGIMTEAVKSMTDWGFKHLDINRIFARPFGHNIASQKVLEKAGYQLEAQIKEGFFKNGRFVDELIYARRKSSIE